MKKTLLILASAAVVFAACNKVEPVGPTPVGEMAVIPLNSDASPSTKGYVEKSNFVETYYNAIHESSKEGKQALRTMQISSYLYPQNGEQKNYFVDKTYSPKDKNNLTETEWWNTNTVGGTHDPIYWPVGGTLDFLAYSVSAEETGAGKSQNVTAAWDETNAASKVVLTIPGENTQNDILFAGAAGIESSPGSTAVPMKFSHAQAWLEFVLKGSVDASNPGGIVTLKRIELEDVYNAGTLTVSNNRGNTFAKWDFSEEIKQDIEVDNFNTTNKLNGTAMYLDMLLPQQTKTAFVIYYTLGSSPKELSYRFTTDQKTWLMGEKYIYNINITTSEVTVSPSVTQWNAAKDESFSYTVKIKTSSGEFGNVEPTFSPSDDSFNKVGEEDGITTYTCDTWGAQITLKAIPEGDAVFVKWSDDVTENPRTFTVTESVNLPEAIFGYEITSTTSEADASRCKENTYKVVAGESATIKATPADGYKFYKWFTDDTCKEYMPEGVSGDITVDGDKIIIASVNAEKTFYAKYIPEDAIAGAFSVSATKKVFFAKGNLYWDGSKFGIEAEQTAFSVLGNETEGYTWNPNYVSLFFWSSNPSVAVAESYNDPDADADDTFFAANGGAIEGYTVLSDEEWSYLLNTASSSGRTYANRFAKAKVNGITGLLLFPDGYNGGTAISGIQGIGTINNASTEAFPTENIGVEDWKSMQNAGVVFLPASGYRSGSNVFNVGSDGNYWSATPYDEYSACGARFSEGGVGVGYSYRDYGISVRLVSE